MSKFKHHSYFPKTKAGQQFRFPFLCFGCRKSFKYPAAAAARLCPQCRTPMVLLSRKFSAPKSRDIVQWKKVELLVAHGFRFHSVSRAVDGNRLFERVRYPTTLEEAKAFVLAFSPQA